MSLQEKFMQVRGAPISVGSLTVNQLDRLPIQHALVTIKFMSDHHGNGVALKSAKGGIVLTDGRKVGLLYIWNDTSLPQETKHIVDCPDGELKVWNIYRVHHANGQVTEDSWTGNAGREGARGHVQTAFWAILCDQIDESSGDCACPHGFRPCPLDTAAARTASPSIHLSSINLSSSNIANKGLVAKVPIEQTKNTRRLILVLICKSIEELGNEQPLARFKYTTRRPSHRVHSIPYQECHLGQSILPTSAPLVPSCEICPLGRTP